MGREIGKIRKHKFVYGMTINTGYAYARRICKICGQYANSGIHRVRGWKKLLVVGEIFDD